LTGIKHERMILITPYDRGMCDVYLKKREMPSVQIDFKSLDAETRF